MDPNRFDLSHDASIQPDFFSHLRVDHTGYIEIDNEDYRRGRRGKGTFISRGTVAAQLYMGQCFLCPEPNITGEGNHRECEAREQWVADQGPLKEAA